MLTTKPTKGRHDHVRAMFILCFVARKMMTCSLGIIGDFFGGVGGFDLDWDRTDAYAHTI